MTLSTARWPEFICVEIIEAMTCLAAMVKQIVTHPPDLY